MKHIASILCTSFLMFGLMAYAQNKTTEPMKGKKILVAYFSWSGNTKAAAQYIALTADEVSRLEALADATGIDTRGEWEHTME